MKTSKAVAYAVSLAIAAAAAPGMAADNATDASAELQEIVVTGTSIKGVTETSLPVQILSSEDVQRTGATNVEQLFRQIAAASSVGSTVASQATGFTTGAISTISLRGLGSERTLVLINGLRSAAYGGSAVGGASTSVDISSIPVSAIERVEILKDGASAIYGSDAIAGVVNFILKSDFQGLSISANGGTPTHAGGGSEEGASLFAGIGDIKSDGYNVNFGINYDHQGQILGNHRSFAGRYQPQYGNDVTSSFAFPANVNVPGSHAAFTNPAFPKGSTQNPDAGNCGPYSLNDVNFPAQCRFDNTPFDDLQPDITKLGFLLQAELALNDSNKLYGLASFSQVRTITEVQPVPLSNGNPLLPSDPYYNYLATALAPGGQFAGYGAINPGVKAGTGAFLLPNTSPYYPLAAAEKYGLCTGATASTCQPLNLIYRDFANGVRVTEDLANTTRLIGGIKGDALGWDYDAHLLFSSVGVYEDLDHGFALYSKVMPLLDQGNINPFGPTTDASQIALAQQDAFYGQDFRSRTSLASGDFTVSRDLFQTPWGPFAGALGGEIRRETFSYQPSAAIQTGDIAGEGGNALPVFATRSAESAYVEFNSPILPALTADVAVRWDNYQRVGDTVNPKGSLKWEPTAWLLLRGSAGTGFRAPSLTDLYAPQTRSVTSNGTRDPIQCPVFSAANPACSFQFTTIQGGNPNLQPEKSNQYSLGTVLKPVQNLTLDFDAWWIFLRNSIVGGGLPYQTILANAASAAQFSNLIIRDAAGNIVSISQQNSNLFKSAVSGLDMDFRYFVDLPSQGRVTADVNGTYFLKYQTELVTNNGDYTNFIDQPYTITADSGVISRFRYNATLDYAVGDFEVSLIEHYQKRYHDAPSSISGAKRFVGQYQTFDLQGSYTLAKSTQFTLGIINLFNTAPPYANYAASANNFVGGYDLSYGDARGEFVYARVTYQFH
ncbi:MAG TPA: TonB-dependent receptor [Steroidobacteraceae bacterium]|jgi:iron complex outermembrane receptor protein|nr:TonB-dependent receptor [Steroidobacteraceae bacterium]